MATPEAEAFATPEDRGDFLEEQTPTPAPETPSGEGETETPSPPALGSEETPPPAEEETPPPAEEEEPPAEKEELPKEPTIPKARLDAEIAKRHRLQEDLIRSKAQFELLQQQAKPAEATAPATPAEPAFDFKGQRADMMKLLYEGKSDEAAAVQEGIDQANHQLVQTELRREFKDALEGIPQQTQEGMVFQAAQAKLTGEYPVFDEQHADYDADLLTKANQMFMRMSSSPGANRMEALRDAVEFTLMRERPELLVKTPAEEEEPAPAEGKTAPPVADIRKKVAAAAAQPPVQEGKRADTHGEIASIDVMGLPEEEFDALPASVIKKLRGD